jgi:hypothetical protein
MLSQSVYLPIGVPLLSGPWRFQDKSFAEMGSRSSSTALRWGRPVSAIAAAPATAGLALLPVLAADENFAMNWQSA